MIENLENEEWRDIEEYPNYQISNYGRVKSLGNNKTRKEKILKLINDRYGYLLVGLYKDGKKNFYLVHRLVAQAFIPNPDNLSQVNHRNELKTENFVENLEWCDAKYNSNYGTRTKRIAEKRSKQVYQYTLQGELIKVWNSTAECYRNGFYQGSISRCCNNKRYKTSQGYIWSYLPKV